MILWLLKHMQLFCHLESFWHMLLLKTNHNQPNVLMKTKGCDARLKCKIRMANYKYGTKGVFLCIQFSFILRLKGSIKETEDRAFAFASCHHIHIHNTLANTTKFGFVYVNRKKGAQKSVDVKFQVKVGCWVSINHL